MFLDILKAFRNTNIIFLYDQKSKKLISSQVCFQIPPHFRVYFRRINKQTTITKNTTFQDFVYTSSLDFSTSHSLSSGLVSISTPLWNCCFMTSMLPNQKIHLCPYFPVFTLYWNIFFFLEFQNAIFSWLST